MKKKVVTEVAESQEGGMTLRAIIDLREGLRKIKGIKARDFAYKVEQNIVAITDALRGALPQEEEMNAKIAPYHNDIIDLCEKHKIALAKELDEVQKKELEKEFEANYAKLDEKHADIIAEYKNKKEELNKMYKTTFSDYKPIKFKLHLVPKDLANEHFQSLFPLIINTEE